MRIELDVDRRMDDNRVASVDALDARGNEMRVSDELVDGLRALQVFLAQIGREEFHRELAAKTCVTVVFVVHVPQVPHRRMAVADVTRALRLADALDRA